MNINQGINSRKRVSFHEDGNEYYDNTQWFADDCHGTWYTKTNFKEFRAATRKCVLEWQTKTENNKFSLVIQAIRALYREAHNVDYELHDASELMANSELESLSELISNSDDGCDFVGMEHLLLESITKNVYRRRRALYEVVNDIQREHRQGLWEDETEMLDEMQESCLNFSQCSFLFSQLVALARQAAV